mmetsp:Transcript_78519/g.127403  ORF Transcript_78519/g.127403 Transcript_78519/m.127403 type:complete len:329 (+) Transcript_78519:2-988(+)
MARFMQRLGLILACFTSSQAFLSSGTVYPLRQISVSASFRLRGGAGTASLSMTDGVKRVLVTGANKGIGLATVEKLLCDYPECHVILGSRSAERGAAAVEQLLKKRPDAHGRLEMLLIDTSDDKSVIAAAATVRDKFGADSTPLYGIINNAGIGFGRSLVDTLQTNTYGPYRVNNAFLPLVQPEGGRIVQIASASGPMFVAGVSGEWKRVFTDPNVQWEEIEKTMQEALTGSFVGEAYGFSKACLNAYTQWFAKQHPALIINACTPGFIATDLTKGMGATNSPEIGAVVPVALVMGAPQGPGFYFGSDGVRSPLDRYRGPGDPPYVGR